MKKPDLLILIAIWEFFTSFIVLIGIAAIVVFAFPAVLGNWGNWNSWMPYDGYYNGMMGSTANMPMVGAIFGLSVAILVLFCYLVVAIIAGIGLLMGKEWGRITAIVHSGLSLCSFPIGTVIGVMTIIYLTKQEVKEFFVPQPKI
jgi:hypothetical protein